MSRPAFKFTPGERHIFRRREFVAVSRWAANSVIVQDGPYRGARLRLDVAPYLAGIMDAFARPGVEEIRVCGAPQTGKTLAMYACLGYAVDFWPGTKMLAMPDDETLKRVREDKLLPLLMASPVLKNLTGKATERRICLKDGSSLFLSSSQSPSQRASITVRHLFLDEEDLYQKTAGRGDPVTDFTERTRSYAWGRKIVRVSKPVGDARSSIWRAVTQDVDLTLAYRVVCPSCFGAQFMVPERVRVLKVNQNGKEAEPAPAEIVRARLGRYECEHCGYEWTDVQRDMAVARGRWAPVTLSESGAVPKFREAGEVAGARRLGFYLPAILSSVVSLSEVAAGRLKSDHSDSPDDKQAYQNGVWALPYVSVTMEPDEAAILSRRDFALPARTVPHGAVCLTCGIDTQKRGFYYLVEAWMPSKARYVIDYGRLAEFADVTRLIWENRYPVLGPDDQLSGSFMEIWRAAMDTGGTATDEGVHTRTEEVYEYLRRFGGGVIHAAKGSSRELAGVAVRWSVLDRMPRTQARIPGGLMLYMLDTAKIKGAMFNSLLDEEARRPIKIYGHDPGLDPADQAEIHTDLAAQLCAERLVRAPNGKMVWEQTRKDNHYLDCLMLSEACADVSWTPSLDHIIMQIEAEARRPAEEERRERREKKEKRRTSRW
ncbi:phage terminase large subunit family protein [Deltaproteobacteria bacterium OttesenSCG-928-M10]|nr:phage terminase large subunit family protein [Deltaproteobacteria bacterium OttesenSCG-928-M10]